MIKALVFGEILFDRFESTNVLGGAPFNFACHFSLCGGSPYLFSAVGNDSDGKTALSEATRYNVNTKYTYKVANKTGYCDITLKNGVPNYNLLAEVAYDNIPYFTPEEKFDCIYFGTLAQRCHTSRETLKRLLCESYGEVFFDINIRQNYYNKEIITDSLNHATILKASREEMHVFSKLGISPHTEFEKFCFDIAEKFNLRQVILTLDKDGGMVFDTKTNSFTYSKKPTSTVVSTVGGGDSFSAAYLYSYLSGNSIEKSLDEAVTLSDYVVTQLGAVCEHPNKK